MNALAGPFQQLVERRLWPLALVLVAALVAVPMLLSKSPSSDVLPAPVAAVGPTGQAGADLVVSQADPAQTDKLRAVLGDRKDPFRPAQIHRVPKPKTADTGTGVQTQVGTGVSGDTSTGTSGGGGGSAAPPAPSTPPTTPDVTATPTPKPEVFSLYSLQVRFGLVDGDLATRNVKRLAPLPSAADPAILYLGLSEDHKSAVFLVDAGVKTLGDGSCDPAPKNCETLTLKPGQTEFLTRGKKQWQLDLIAINTKKTTDAKAAAASRTAVSRSGAKALRAMAGRARSYRYDSTSGTLRKVPVRPAKTSMKRASLAHATIASSG